MAVPLFWKQQTYLCAFGNTPAHSVAQYIEPEDPAEFLLLVCGDARNVLYTVYASGADSPNNARMLDFTCNDSEPAVLARNALLYSLLKEDPTLAHIDRIWSIYFDLKLDDGAVTLLRAQCAKLHAASASPDAWAASPFSGYMRVATAHTLDEMHRLFGLFLAPDPKLAQLTRAFNAAQKEHGAGANGDSEACSVLRAAGPLWMQFGVELARELRARYWAPATGAKQKHANPTLAFSRAGGDFPLHDSALPCTGFHLAEVAAGRPPDSATVADVDAVCKAQFRAWAAAFANARGVVVRFCAGDAAALCHALARSPSTGLFAAPWTNTPLVLLDDGPRRFAAIDSGTLADDIGLVNVLLLAAPLLAPSARAALFTESLHASCGTAVQSFRAQLCGSPGAMALLLGIAPAGVLDGALGTSQAHEIMLARVHAAAADGAGCERVAWRRLPSAARLQFDAAELSRLLVDVHYELFQSEDGAALRPKLLAAGLAVPRKLARLASHITYVRGTFVALVAQLRRRLECTDAQWAGVVKDVLDRAGKDKRLMIGDCSYQDLCLHLEASGLAAGLVPHFTRVPGQAIDVRAGPLAGWPREDIGRLVWAALRIPVSAFGVLDGNNVEPPHELFFATRTPRALNYFATFAAFRGAVTQRGSTFEVSPDADADADVVAVALVPAWLVMSDVRSTTLSITVRPGALSGAKLMEKLGPQFEVFGASVLDASRAFFASTGAPPTVDGVPIAPLYDREKEASHDSEVVTVALDTSKKGDVRVATMMLRAGVESAGERAAWSAKADVEVVQLSPVEAEVRTVCGAFTRRLRFPLPVDVRNARLRVARKSFWVEVIAPLAQPAQTPHARFHAVNLDRLPVLDTARHAPQWLDMHGQFAFSDTERANRDGPREDRTPHVDVKDDILALLLRAAGLAENPVRVFCLVETRPGQTEQESVYAFVFVRHLRLDCAANTVVADAYVLPVPGGTHPDVDVVAGAFRHPAPMAALWRRLLVAFAERCRGGKWAHKPSCPRARNRLCACGAGTDVAGFRAVREWTASGAKAADVTRVAISLPCAPHFVESVGGHMPNFAREHGDTSVADFFASFAPVSRSVAEYGLAAGPGARMRRQQARNRCARCGNDEPRVRCPMCGNVAYCDKNCMRMHAKAHKSACAGA